ncbi:DUF4276 family protein [Myxococcus sp. CA051A]|uniref:DUF4276 family protein n=1 Tax=Myxococcus sp. CA051A TaxID=2741739 RepID=UPI00157A9DFA|nr:DUF4276 family protein [Myxococcus sp. CA051A]
MKKKRLVCIVEGKGEVEAIPNLCSRILASLSLHDWLVDQAPIRQPRGHLVDARIAGPSRPCRPEGMTKALSMAWARNPDAVLVMCDSDDDCPSIWAKSVPIKIPSGRPVAAVMAVREFEGWLLRVFNDNELGRIRVVDPERIRNAKGRLEQLVPGYAPTTHQLMMTRKLDISAVRNRSRSFDKLVRTIGALCGGTG